MTNKKTFQIRKGSARDTQLLNDICYSCGEAAYEDDVVKNIKCAGEGNRVIFIIEENGLGVGYCIFNCQPRYALFKKLDIPAIQDLKIIPEFRRSGLATMLIHYCENYAHERGYNDIGISVALHSGFGPAQRLYVKLGYVPDGAGVTYNRKLISPMEMRPIDDDLCLMLVKPLS
ncbi:MAG: GNAT family N-acetyltransferase [Alphaproteobacteria bacterium]|mgnify:CR=1 FL=1|nr:GNAT family N-acetyltransferase [Alphaproteobacteria bacterium]